jgi:hypothetical protein
MDEYIIVVEYQAGGSEQAVEYDVVDALVEELRDWHPAALFSPERYALQLHVPAVGPTDALRQGLALHDRAVRGLGMPEPVLARIEVLTGREFDSQWRDDVHERLTLPGDRGTVLANELYWATRALLRANNASALTDVLVDFVTSVGGQVQDRCPETSDQVVIDVSLEDDGSLFATAERVSVAGMILAFSLAALVADARTVLGRHQQWRSECKKGHLPDVKHWCRPDEEG